MTSIPTSPLDSATTMSRPFLTNIFNSLARDNRRWALLRTLKSDNPMDIQGELRGVATFTQLSPLTTTSDIYNRNDTNTTTKHTHNNSPLLRDMIYQEEGEMPQTLGVGLRWTKKYMWRMSDDARISVWFVKVGTENEADYLFHDFDFGNLNAIGDDSNADATTTTTVTFVTPPIPPVTPGSASTTTTAPSRVVTARGNHLCINDMYRTAYAFRVDEESGEVISWASRHVVKGPKKNQDIVNLYQIEG